MANMDYWKMKMDVIHADKSKSQQEQAQEKLAAERQAEQAKVDSVLYGNGGRNTEDESQKKKNPLDTHNYAINGDEVDATAKVTPPPAPQKTASNVTKIGSKRNDADVDDFESSFAEGDSVYEDMPEEDANDDGYVVPTKNVDESYDEDQYDEDYDDDDTEDEYDEQYRREQEAALRARTEQFNKRNQPKPKPQQTRPTSARNQSADDDDVAYSYLRKVPRSLVDKVQGQFPAANTKDEAVAAYIYLKEGKPNDVSVPDRIKEVARSYVGSDITPKDVQDELMKSIMQLSMQLKGLTKKSGAIELAIAYMLFDYMGFRKKDQSTTAEVDFLEKGMNELISNLEKSSEVKAMKDRNRAGTLRA